MRAIIFAICISQPGFRNLEEIMNLKITTKHFLSNLTIT
jgi:hypothetical protein